MSYKLMLDKKHKDGLLKLGTKIKLNNIKILDPKESKPNLSYRAVAKLAIRPNVNHMKSYEKHESIKNGRFSIGLFQPSTHKIVDLKTCPIHNPLINKCLSNIRACLEESSLTPWNEEKNCGDLRYLIIRSSHRGNELMLTFVVSNKNVFLELRRLVKKIQQNVHISASFMNVHNEDGNKVLGETTKKIAGADRLRISLCGLSLHLSPTSFFQVNPFVAEKIYHRIEQLIGVPQNNQTCAWDLYCGIGHIGLIMARAGYRVFGLEENPGSIVDAQYNSRMNQLEEKTKFVSSKVEDFLSDSEERLPSWAQSPQIIIVNPSRKGLSESVIKYFIEMKNIQSTHRIIYISCNIDSFARDLDQLTSAGYRLSQIESFDMFAQTDKLEWLAVLH